MKIPFYKQEYDVKPEEIKEAEGLYGYNFPNEFKEFLLQYNGGFSYPYFPTIETENGFGLYQIDMFYSLGDIIVRKHQILNANHPEHLEEDLNVYNLKNENLLTFANGERGWYFMDLSNDGHGQLYFCDYSGGDGIVKIKTKSFNKFINSLNFHELDDTEYDSERESKMNEYIPYKITQPKYFFTPFKPEIGLKHFKNTFAYFIEKLPPKERIDNLGSKYVNEQDKLEFLLQQGCDKDGLLLSSDIKAQTIIYLVTNLGLDLNKPHKGKYPIHSYLTAISTPDIKVKYQLVHDILAAGLNIDWSVTGKLYSDTDKTTALHRLSILNAKYRKYENDENERYGDAGLPHGSKPFFRSEHIEKLLESKESKSWMNSIITRITRSTNR